MRRTLQEHGWAVASINYRYSHQAIFPGDLHDVKEAVRFFRARAAEFGIDPERIAIAGGSAGGHLSMMAALTGPDTAGYAGGDPELHEYYEGRASSSYPAVNSTVAAAVPFYGVSDLRTIFTDRPLAGYALDHPEDDGAEWRLLGCDYPLSEEHEWVEHVPGIGRGARRAELGAGASLGPCAWSARWWPHRRNLHRQTEQGTHDKWEERTHHAGARHCRLVRSVPAIGAGVSGPARAADAHRYGAGSGR